MEDRERLAMRRWLTRVSMEMDEEPESWLCVRERLRECEWECLEDAPEEPWLRRNEAADEAAMMVIFCSLW